jgi:hypothetical protein
MELKKVHCVRYSNSGKTKNEYDLISGADMDGEMFNVLANDTTANAGYTPPEKHGKTYTSNYLEVTDADIAVFEKGLAKRNAEIIKGLDAKKKADKRVIDRIQIRKRVNTEILPGLTYEVASAFLPDYWYCRDSTENIFSNFANICISKAYGIATDEIIVCFPQIKGDLDLNISETCYLITPTGTFKAQIESSLNDMGLIITDLTGVCCVTITKL